MKADGPLHTGGVAPGPSGPPDDLIARYRAGDEAAWADVYRACAPTIALFLRRLLGPVRDLDDLVQQVFVIALSSAGGYRGDSRMSTWLYGIATHVAAKHQRREFRWRRRREAWSDWLASADPAPDAVEAAEARALLRIVAGVLDRLDFRHRTVWVLRELEDLSTDQVAVALDIPVGTVRSRLFAARREVLAALRDAGFDSDGDTRPAVTVRRLDPPGGR